MVEEEVTIITCGRCGAEVESFIYVAATEFKHAGDRHTINTWCVDLCSDCEKLVVEFIGKVR